MCCLAWLKACVRVHARASNCAQARCFFFFGFFSGMRMLETDSGALTHQALMHVFIRALGEAERAGQ